MTANNGTGYISIQRPIKISTYDIDFAGHVSNITYLRWMEDLRLALFEDFFPLKGFMDEGLLPIITSTSIDYKKAVQLFDKPVGVMAITEVRPASVYFSGEIIVEGEVTTIASHVGAFIKQETNRPVRVPKIIAERFKMESFLAGK